MWRFTKRTKLLRNEKKSATSFGGCGFFLYFCNIQFGEVREPSGLTSPFLLKIEGFYFKPFCTIDDANDMMKLNIP